MSFLAPIAIIAGLLAVPIILLYMLRLRRREVPVSSTYLWQQIMQDREANAPWQRLRRNLLLLLQLLILALLVFALMRPFFATPTVTTGHIALLLDASASMSATDIEPSRFDAARQEALAIVNNLSPTDTVTVIRVADIPEVLASSTNDATMLRNAIQNAAPSSAAADWNAALTLAAAGATGVEDFNVVMIGDGGLPIDLPPLPGGFRYVPIGQSGENVAITAMAARAQAGETPQIFTEVANLGEEAVEVILSLELDGVLTRAERILVPERSVREIFFTDLEQSFTTAAASLTPVSGSDIENYLTIDDTAATIYNPPGAGRVLLMTPGNVYLREALTSLPGLEAYQGELENGLPTGQGFDLYIMDGWLPEDGMLPPGDLLIIDPPADHTLFTRLGRSMNTDNIRVAPDDPRTLYLNFDNVNILDFTVLDGIDWADPLVWTDDGPLVMAGTVDGRQVAIITFDLHRSDLPLQITWPILLANLLEWYTPAQTVTETALQVGDTLALNPPFEADRVRITSPDGDTTTIRIGQDPLIYTDTAAPGVYTVNTFAGDTLLREEPFAVNLFDRDESFILPAETLTIGAEQVAEAEREAIGQREVWWMVALMALGVLLLEWILYQRRVRLPKAAEEAWMQGR